MLINSNNYILRIPLYDFNIYVLCKLKLKNSSHGQWTIKQFYLIVKNVNQKHIKLF